MVELYTKDNCTYCVQAKQVLRDRQIQFVEYKLNEDFTREIILEMFPEAKTFPVVVVDGFRIGGFTELRQMLNEEMKSTTKFLAEGAA